MHVLVLTTGNPLLEEALLTAGHTVSLLAPAAGMPRPPAPGVRAVHTISHWDDLDALPGLNASLPDIDAVATIDEQCIVTAARLRALRGLPGLTVDAALAHTDKHVMKTSLAAAGLPVAGHRLIHHADEIPRAAAELGWPVIVKPRAAAATWNTFVIRDEAHLKELVTVGAFERRIADITGRFSSGHALDSLHGAVDGFLVEEFLSLAAEYWTDLYLHEDEVVLAAPGRYDQPLLQTVGAASADTVLHPDHPEARAVASLAIRAAGVLGARTGAVHAEILRTTDGRLLIGEAAARVGGDCITEITGLMYNIDVPATLAALAVGARPSPASTARYPALTAIMISAPPGTVTSVASEDHIKSLPGVVDARISLRIGAAVPASAGTVTGGGRVLCSSTGHDEVERDVARVRAALEIRVSAPHHITACVS